MELPKLEKSEKYVGLYIFDFGDHTGVGFTAQEVAELLESEKYAGGKVYKIHRAYPDGKLELKGVPAETFELEAGMFFYSSDREDSRRDFKQLVDLARSCYETYRVSLEERKRISYWLKSTRVKILAADAGVESISTEDKKMVIRMAGDRRVEKVPLERAMGDGVKVGINQVRLDIKRLGTRWQEALFRTLQAMAEG